MDKKKPGTFLIIVTGPPASGKSGLARRLAADLHLPLIFKDGIKESLFDTLGWSDRAWSKQLGSATYGILFYILDALLAAGVSLVVESNFKPELHNPDFQQRQARYGFEAIQVLCRASPEVLRQRFRARAASAERHPGHVDHTTFEELEAVLAQSPWQALDLEGALIEVDTSDFEHLDYEGILASIQDALRDER